MQGVIGSVYPLVILLSTPFRGSQRILTGTKSSVMRPDQVAKHPHEKAPDNVPGAFATCSKTSI
jgi:hypothetical protein